MIDFIKYNVASKKPRTDKKGINIVSRKIDLFKKTVMNPQFLPTI